MFDLPGILGPGQAQSKTQTLDMSVYGDTLMVSKSMRENDIGRLSGHSRQGQKVLHGGRNLGIIILYKCAGALNEVLGLIPVQAGGADNFFHFRLFGLSQIQNGGPTTEEVGSDSIDPGVGALGGQYGGHQELPGRMPGKLAAHLGISLTQTVQDGFGPGSRGFGEVCFVHTGLDT